MKIPDNTEETETTIECLKRRTKEEYRVYLEGYRTGLYDGQNKSPEFCKAIETGLLNPALKEPDNDVYEEYKENTW